MSAVGGLGLSEAAPRTASLLVEEPFPPGVRYGLTTRRGWAMTQQAEAYRNNADQCRRLAERSCRPEHRESWLKIAEQWLKMADEVDLAERGNEPNP
jgi:hypothetical protein